MMNRCFIATLMLSTSLVWGQCVPEVTLDHPMGFIPGQGGLIEDPIQRIRAMQKSIISFSRGSVIEEEKIYYRGSVISSTNPRPTIEILKRSHDQVQTCRVRLSFFDNVADDGPIDLGTLGELVGFSATVKSDEVEMTFTQAEGRGMMKVRCVNEAGSAPITYRTMAETLGIQFFYSAADLCLEPTPDCGEEG